MDLHEIWFHASLRGQHAATFQVLLHGHTQEWSNIQGLKYLQTKTIINMVTLCVTLQHPSRLYKLFWNMSTGTCPLLC